MNARAYIIIYIVLVAMLLSCKEGSGPKPSSGGEPYEVLVVTGNKELRALADSLLETSIPELPQHEPMFRLSHTDRLTAATQYARCIVGMETAPTGDGRTKVAYWHEKTARPQLIINITTPSVARLKADADKVGRTVRTLVNRFELTTEQERLEKHHSPKVSETIGRRMGWTLYLPTELSAMKWGTDFVWASSDTPEGVRCICLYTYPGKSLDPQRLIEMRDSVLGANIPGERPPMRMVTERRVAPIQKILRGKRQTVLETRGLWQMEGDAMGGPFVSRAVVDSQRGRVVVAEAFVYAPERKKGNMLRRLEAALHSLERVKEQNK